jgi:hypothetical protein
MAESAFGGSLESGCRVVAFGRNVALVAVEMFSHLISFLKEMYRFNTFNAICVVNAEVKCITELYY